MLIPPDVIAGLWLAAWPAWGGAVVPLPSEGDDAPFAVEEAAPAFLLDLSDEDLAARIEADPGSIGSLSIGAPGSGVLFNAVRLPDGGRWELAANAAPWGTSEAIAAVQVAIDTVHQVFPDTLPLWVGDISNPGGGRLKRHETHQAGRDVDFGFYYKHGKGAYFTPGTAANLDLPRNWALVRALVTLTDVETILLDTRIQRLLYKYALDIGEDKAWLDRVFQFSRGSAGAIIRHVPAHRTHYHVRFYSPIAQELGRRAHPTLVRMKIMDPPVFTVRHVVRAGQTLGHLAARYGTSVRAIMQANGLRSTQIRAGRAYRIPVRAVAPPAEPIVVPPRLLPPHTPAAMAAVAWPDPQGQ